MLGFEGDGRCGICGHNVWITMRAAGCFIGKTLDGHVLTTCNDPVGYEVDRCPNCGFCSPTIGDPRGVSIDDLREPVYRRMLEVCSPHECAAYLLSIHGHHRDAAYMFLHGAWLSDPDGIRLRHLAISEMLREQPRDDDLLVMTDMLRCIGYLDHASVVADAILSRKGDAFMWGRAQKEMELIMAGDTSQGMLSYDDDGGISEDPVVRIGMSGQFYRELVSDDGSILVHYGDDHPLKGDVLVVEEDHSRRATVFTVVDSQDAMIPEDAVHLHLSRERASDSWPTILLVSGCCTSDLRDLSGMKG